MMSIDQARQFLNTKYKMNDLGEMNYFPGIEVDRNNKGIFLSQRKYISYIVEDYGLLHCKPIKIHMNTHVKLLTTSWDPLPNPVVYQRFIGKLICLTITRPNIGYTVHVLSQFMHNLTSTHYQDAKRILKYLARSREQGILLATKFAAQLRAYCDSDWAGLPSTRRSTSDFCIILGHSPLT